MCDHPSLTLSDDDARDAHEPNVTLLVICRPTWAAGVTLVSNGTSGFTWMKYEYAKDTTPVCCDRGSNCMFHERG